MSNYPILWQNALMQYSSEIVKKAWIWFAETRGDGMQYQADAYANEVAVLTESIAPMIGASLAICENQGINPARGEDECLTDMMKFILKRHANYRFGGNVKMWWEHA